MPVTPLQAAYDVLDRAQALLTLDPGTETASLLEYDCRRQAVAMGVAALDTWMHWSIRGVPLCDLSPKLAGLSVPFGDLVSMGEKSVDARRSGKNDRPVVRARNVLNEQILRMTFQSADQWTVGFAFLGIRSGLAKTATAMGAPHTRETVIAKLNGLSRRRNAIVHEGDLHRLMRPRRIVRSKLPRPEVDRDLTWIRDFLTAADTVG